MYTHYLDLVLRVPVQNPTVAAHHIQNRTETGLHGPAQAAPWRHLPVHYLLLSAPLSHSISTARAHNRPFGCPPLSAQHSGSSYLPLVRFLTSLSLREPFHHTSFKESSCLGSLCFITSSRLSQLIMCVYTHTSSFLFLSWCNRCKLHGGGGYILATNTSQVPRTGSGT